MIAIKQAKFKPSNKIQENQIKNITTTTTKPSNVAQIDDQYQHNNQQLRLHNHHQQHNQNRVISSKNDNFSCQAQQQDGPPSAAAAVKSTVSDNDHQRPHHHHHQTNNHHQQQQQSNETRSETIDGVTTTASAVPTKSSTTAPPSSRAASTLATLPSSTATTSSLSTAATVAAASPASASPMAVKQARQQLQQAHQPATSLTTASAKIQQRQQKFLAAAARSATSPQCHLDQNLSVIKQQQQQQQATTRISCVASSESCSRIDGPTPAASMVTADDCTWCKATGPAPIECEQCTTQKHAQDASSAGNRSVMALKTASKKSCSLASAEHKLQSQQMTAVNKRQTVPLLATPPSKSETIDHHHNGVTMARSKVLSMATAMMNGNGPNLKNSACSKQRASVDNDQYRSNSAMSCASLGATEAIAAAAASPESCVTAAAAPAAAANIEVPCDVGDFGCNQKCARPASPLRCDASTNLSTTKTTTTTGAYQQQVSPSAAIISQKRAEVRQQSSGEQQNNDDNISNKNTTTTTKHNNHYHYHHYYNQNYLNFHRFQQQQQQQQPHQNYFHQQNQHTTINSSTNQTTTQSQHQPVMAHYKFHNDCQSSVLTYEQVKRLDFVMDQTVPIHGRGNSPTLYVKLKELIRLVKYKLQHEHSIEIRDVRLNGGAASYVLAPENSKYNDLDLVFGTDLSNEDRFDVIRDVVLDCLMEFYPQGNQTHDQSSTVGAEEGGSLRVNGSNIELTGGNNEDEEDEDDQQASRSNRSSSFESDNLNVTTNELGDDASDGSEEEDDDEEDDVIVRIDSDDTGCGDLDGKNEEEDKEEEDGASELIARNTGSDLIGHRCDTVAQIAHKQEEDAVEPTTIAEHQHHASYPSYSSYHQYHQMPPNNINMNINNCAFKEAYVHKMVKVNDDDRWSLISLGVQQSETGYVQQAHSNQQFAAVTNQQPHTSPTPANWCNNLCANQQRQQNQLPNSIELKFVDKMRRKFEFSVDSFQIILDSLVQFYDFAPQSTITIQRKTSSGNPIFNVNPLMGLRHCLQCDREQGRVEASGTSETSVQEPIKSAASSVGKCKTAASQSAGKKYTSRPTHCETTSLSGARSFYELPIEPSNSLSNSSVASSSGCSSSSSVVSSSSSSLSCDEDQDQEDLYCDVDNSPSSSASTSSLLSSTTTSGAGSPCDPLLVDVESRSSSQQQQQQQQRHQNKHNVISSSGGGQQLTNQHNNNNNNSNYHARRHQQQAAAVAYHVPNCISSTGKQHHVNTGQCTSESLCNNFAAKATISDHKISSCAVISENFYPTVIGRSEYGNFKEALYHLEKKLIATRSPEEIRGGGLLKYCNLLVKNYKPTNVYQIRTLERYMCSRFFIDFSDLNQQRAKLESYLANHFSDDAKQKFDYLTILHNVVQRSTVCLMNHELRLTLNMIREFAYNLPQQQQQNQNQNQTASSNVGQVQQMTGCTAQQQADQQRSPAERPGHFYQQQKPTSMQSGVYRVKLVNYAMAKPVRT